MTQSKAFKLISSLVICQAAGIIGSFFTTPSIPTWYAAIKKPLFTPPNWIFAPVWISLFILMGISLYLIWNAGFSRKDVKMAMTIFGIQLVCNVLWSALFFGMHSPMYAFIELILLWTFILLTILLFYPISRIAAYLLVPYICWVSFAGFLNLSIALLNK